MRNIRKATTNNLPRIAEIVIFNYRLNLYPILQGKSIGTLLLNYVIIKHNANNLWALKKNTRVEI